MARGVTVRRAAGGLALALAACVAPPGQVVIEEDLPERAVNDGPAPVTVVGLHASAEQTVNLLRIDRAVPAHRHLHSQETVYVISGQGVLELEGGTRDLEAGDLVVVPRNTLHGFTPTGGPAVVLSIFTPPFQEGDRLLERER